MKKKPQKSDYLITLKKGAARMLTLGGRPRQMVKGKAIPARMTHAEVAMFRAQGRYSVEPVEPESKPAEIPVTEEATPAPAEPVEPESKPADKRTTKTKRSK